MEKILIMPVVLGFFVTLFSLPYWIKKAKRAGLVWEDMHKIGRQKKIPGSGGITVVFGFVLGVLSYIAIKTFILETDTTTVQIFALMTTILIVGFVGLIDDILGWIHGGLSTKLRIFLVVTASIPLIVINAGVSSMMGLELGLIYPLILIPLGVVGATVTFNFIEGYNGLAASQGILILSALSLVTYLNETTWLSLICLIMISCLFAFYVFNKVPAKIFPGDVLTYPIGALIAVVAILGNIEKIAIFFFIPYILETGLKVRGKLRKQSIAKLNSRGGLEMPYEKFYGIEHIGIYLLKKIKKRGEVHEKELVWFINAFQILIILLGFLLFRGGIT
ncbi:hypothetical protein CMI44_02230 [Candidatus Pacearchaeota archaeon]|nr:hypothetical protein [Candidatus Pacearchaeota archaeon]|tara:strand:- start:15 stop:1016 length:1002 start_codon:yes stop_codon:yes gene_type:complete